MIINSLDINKYTELYQDFLHPNPNINYQAFLILRKEFEVTFINNLLANLNVEDRFILLNSGSASGDGGIVVQTESTNTGVAFAYDDSESRWAFQQGTKLSGDATTVAPDAYASAVVTSDDANYQKNGNIRVEGGEIYIYVE